MFDDIYCSADRDEDISGENEFDHVFFRNNDLPQRWQGRDSFVIAELGLGSGLNCLLTLRQWLKHCAACGEDRTLHYIAIEKYPLSPQAITDLISGYPELQQLCEEFVENYPPAVATTHTRHLFDNRVVIHFRFLDACEALRAESLKVDAWYFDGFSPAKNEAMWSHELFLQVARNSHDETTCSTYTAAGFVRRSLQDVGFKMSKVRGYGKKREMLKGRFCGLQEEGLKYGDKPWFKAATGVAVDKGRMTGKRISVIGAGIAGLSLAYAMVKRGWDVTIIDRHGAVAKEASANPAAVVYPRLSADNGVDTKFYTSAFCYSVYMLAVLQKKYWQQFWFTGGLLQSMEREKLSAIIEKNQFNEDYVCLDERQLVGSGLSDFMDGEESEVFANYRNAGVVLPVVLCTALKELCGEKLSMLHSDVSEVTNNDDRWQCMDGARLIDESDVLVVANGTGINSIGLQSVFPVGGVRGQVAILKASDKSKEISQTINSGKYITPAIDDLHYTGATYARNNTSLEVDPDDTEMLLRSVQQRFPDVFHAEDISASWVGIRSMSGDRVPIVGAVPDTAFFSKEYADICHGRVTKCYPAARHLEGLYVSAAHGSRGFTSSFLSAEIIAAQINNEPPPVSKDVLDYLSPSRFIVNHLKRG